MRENKKFTFWLLFIIFILSTVFTPDKNLDLFRYYEMAESMNMNSSMRSILESSIEASFDFIYFLVFYIFRVLHLPIHLVNGFFVTFFYSAAFSIIKDYSHYNSNVTYKSVNLAMLSMVMAMPLTFVFSIARMTASFAFLFWGLHKLLNHRVIIAIVFAIISFFTHSGTALFMAYLSIAVLLGFVISRIKFLQSHNLISFFVFASFLYIFMEFGIGLILQLPFFNTYHYFATYLEEIRTASFDGLGGITTITLLFYYVCMAIYLWKAKLGFPYNASIYIMLFVVVSYFMSDMFLQRMSMFSIPFFGVLMLSSSKRLGAVQQILTLIAVFLGFSGLVATHRFYF